MLLYLLLWWKNHIFFFNQVIYFTYVNVPTKESSQFSALETILAHLSTVFLFINLFILPK